MSQSNQNPEKGNSSKSQTSEKNESTSRKQSSEKSGQEQKNYEGSFSKDQFTGSSSSPESWGQQWGNETPWFQPSEAWKQQGQHQTNYQYPSRSTGTYFSPLGWNPITEEYEPTTVVYHEEGTLVIGIELPGVATKQVNIQVLEDTIIVTGEKPAPTTNVTGTYWSQNYWAGKFRRVISLGFLPKKKISAVLENGLLSLRAEIPQPVEIPAETIHVSTR